jgi:hypothetical protein
MAQRKTAAQSAVLDENVISTDAGNGWSSVFRLVNGKVKQHGVPHARARVSGAKLNTDLGAQNVAEWALFLGQKWGYGDKIWELTDAPIDTHQNTDGVMVVRCRPSSSSSTSPPWMSNPTAN